MTPSRSSSLLKLTLLSDELEGMASTCRQGSRVPATDTDKWACHVNWHHSAQGSRSALLARRAAVWLFYN